jgi:hypothetical protein
VAVFFDEEPQPIFEPQRHRGHREDKDREKKEKVKPEK